MEALTFQLLSSRICAVPQEDSPDKAIDLGDRYTPNCTYPWDRADPC